MKMSHEKAGFSELTIKAYGKINLALDVTGKREDGYHTVRTVMQKIELSDEIVLSWTEDINTKDHEYAPGIDIRLSTNKPYLPTDERNLAYRAAKIMCSQTQRKGQLIIRIKKRIPVSAGLAGGSSDAAAVLIGLNKLWHLNKNTWQLCELGKELGADVPFCVLTQNTGYRCALGEGIGDKLTTINKSLRKHIILAKPAFGVSTKEVFAGIDICPIEKRPGVDKLIEAIYRGDTTCIYGEMINVLEAYTINRYKDVKKLKEKVEETQGVQKVLMSGSGPTVFGVYDTYLMAKRACLDIRRQGYEAYWTYTGGNNSRGDKNVEF